MVVVLGLTVGGGQMIVSIMIGVSGISLLGASKVKITGAVNLTVKLALTYNVSNTVKG